MSNTTRCRLRCATLEADDPPELHNWPSVTGCIQDSFMTPNGLHYVIGLDIPAVHPTLGVLIHTTTAHADNVEILPP